MPRCSPSNSNYALPMAKLALSGNVEFFRKRSLGELDPIEHSTASTREHIRAVVCRTKRTAESGVGDPQSIWAVAINVRVVISAQASPDRGSRKPVLRKPDARTNLPASVLSFRL